MRVVEAKLHRDGRENAELSKLDPGALELADLMDRTASFSLGQLPAAMTKLKSLAPGGYPATAGSIASASGKGAAPLADLPPPGAEIFGAYVVTSAIFELAIEKTYEQGARTGESYADGKCPCAGTVSDEKNDQVTIDGNKGMITTTTTMTLAWGGGSKVSLDLVVKVSGEVRDAAGAFLYRIQNQTTGHAEGDVCPDATGSARAQLSFNGREEYFHANGTKSGKGVIEGFTGDLRVKADENGTLAGVDIMTTGGLDAGTLSKQLGFELVRLTANRVAPTFEKAWRSGICVEVLVSPNGGEVEKDSETTVTAKVKHRIDGNELDKPVEATFSGVKSIDPVQKKQKAPATFKYTAGPKDGDKGIVTFETVSNRGVGRITVTFNVGGGWTITSTGTSIETYTSGMTNNLAVLIKDLKVTAGKDGTLTGSGTMTLSGDSTVPLGPATCAGKIQPETVAVGVTGTLVGTGPGAVLRLTLVTNENPDSMVALTCSVPGGGAFTTPATPQAHIGFYRQAVGTFDLPADGGTKAISGTVAFSSVLSIRSTATFTVVRGKT
ncbi:MAG TPA: hypothetical protein VIP07_12805 [Candidatus Limnocylindria bacterium]